MEILAAILLTVGNGILSGAGSAICTQQLADLGVIGHPMSKEQFQNYLLTDFTGALSQAVRNIIRDEDLGTLRASTEGLTRSMQEFHNAPDKRLEYLSQLDIKVDDLISQFKRIGYASLPAYSVSCSDHIAILQERYKWFKDENEKKNLSYSIEDSCTTLKQFIDEWKSNIDAHVTIMTIPRHEVSPYSGGGLPKPTRSWLEVSVVCSNCKKFIATFDDKQPGSRPSLAAKEKRAEHAAAEIAKSEIALLNPVRQLVEKQKQFKAKLPSLKPEDIAKP